MPVPLSAAESAAAMAALATMTKITAPPPPPPPRTSAVLNHNTSPRASRKRAREINAASADLQEVVEGVMAHCPWVSSAPCPAAPPTPSHSYHGSLTLSDCRRRPLQVDGRQHPGAARRVHAQRARRDRCGAARRRRAQARERAWRSLLRRVSASRHLPPRARHRRGRSVPRRGREGAPPVPACVCRRASAQQGGGGRHLAAREG